MSKQIPFLRWAGGKRWLVSKHMDLFPKTYNRYIEPFLGGGSVFFRLLPKKAILADLNSELITTYKTIQEDPDLLIKTLKKHANKHSEEYYYHMRNKQLRSQKEIAARFIYLNRTCFNGIYRVNKQGQFNVPFGKKEKILLETDNFHAVSHTLRNCQIVHSDFGDIIDVAEAGDFLFVDPPYTVAHNNNGFIQYNEKFFSWDDQVRLSEKLLEAKNRGVLIMMTNANHKNVRELYEKNFNLLELSRYTSISGVAENRKSYSEIIVRSY